MKRRILGILMALVLLISLVPAQAITALAAETGATITLSGNTGGGGWGQQSSTGFSSVWVVVNDTAYRTNNSSVIVDSDGNAVIFAPGEYTVYYATQGASNCRTGSVTIAESTDGSETVTMSSVTFSRVSSTEQHRLGKAIYYNASSFDHLDIRVAGSYVMDLGGVQYAATVSNPSVVVNVDGVQTMTAAFTGTTSYEWRKTRISLSRASFIEVVLTLDLTYTGADGQLVTLEDLVITYDNVNNLNKFIEAIVICDQQQGLDFTVSVEDIQEVVEEHIVTYQWKVVDENGNYVEIPMDILAPDDTGTYDTNQEHTLDIWYEPGTSYADYENGKLYTFQGWETYSHNDEFSIDENAEGYTGIEENDTSITITADTWINGIWVVSDLPVASAHIAISKVFQADTDGDGDIDITTADAAELPATLANAAGLWFRIDPGYDADGDGVSRVDVDYPMIKAAGGQYQLAVYQYDVPFTIKEQQADVTGWKRTTAVAVSENTHSYSETESVTTAAVGFAADTDTATLTLTEVYGEEDIRLGTVTFTNTYTKIIGTPISRYPSLTVMKSAADTNATQAGAEFSLYDAAGVLVKSYTTGEGGTAVIDFTDMAAGEYTLRETKAPDGYYINSTPTTIKLTEGTPVEQLINGAFVQITTYTASVIIPANSTGTVYNEAFQRIHYYDQPVLGSVAISKAFAGLADSTNASATVVIHGPITMDAAGNVTAMGRDYTVTLNQANGFAATLNELPLGTYLVNETLASIHGYTWTDAAYAGLTETKTVNGIAHMVMEVTDGTQLTLGITNTYEIWQSAEFYIRKNNPSGAPLGGAVFTLFSDEACTQAVAGKTGTTDAAGYVRFDGFTVPAGDSDGVIEYYLKETTAPAGYSLSPTVYKVEFKAVTEDGVTAYQSKISVKNGDAWMESSDFNRDTDLLTVVDQPLTGSLVITKDVVVSNYDEDLPQGLASVAVRVTGTNYSKDVYLNAANNWTGTLENLPLGSYTVREIGGNVAGYTLITTYAVDGTAVTAPVATLAESNPGQTRAADRIVSVVEITNTYERNTENYSIPTSIQVLKVDEAGTPLAGATFRLTRTSDNYQISFTTGGDGIATFNMLTGSIVDGIPVDGTYILEEVKAPEGFQASTAKWTVTVTEDDGALRIVLNEEKNVFQGFWEWISGTQDNGWDGQALVLTVPNTRENHTLTVTKTVEHWLNDTQVADPVLDDTAYSFTLKIYDTKDALYKTQDFTLKADEAKSFSIPYGYTYTVTENVPTGALYVPAEETVAGTMGLTDAAVEMINRYYFYDEPGMLLVTKRDTETDEALAGAEYTLYTDAALTTVLDKATSDEEGILLFDLPLADATYYLAETKAPAGYHLDPTVYIVTAEVTTLIDTAYTPTTVRYLEIDADMEYHETEAYLVTDAAIKEVPISVRKEWVAETDVEHPASVDVVLYRDGEKFETVTLSAANNWSYSWEGLTDEYTWTVDEPAVPDGYVKRIDQANGVYIITNYHQNIPLTGDAATLGLWMAVVALSSTGAIFSGRKLRKKEDDEK